MKITVKTELSKASLQKAIASLNKVKEAYEFGSQNAIRYATETLYNYVIAGIQSTGKYTNLGSHVGDVYYEYDEQTNVGRVFTNDMVIIFHEMGTGITGSDNPHPNQSFIQGGWEYDVNGHGESGWWYPTDASDPNPTKRQSKDGTLYAWTKGLPSSHMFYNAYLQIKEDLPSIVDVEISKIVGNIY